MSPVQIRVLLLEDNADDAGLLQAALAEHAPGEFAVLRVERLADALARVGTEPFDVVLSDLGLPDSRGLATVQALRTHAPDLPLVVLTGSADDDLGRGAIAVGAQDYLVKGESSGALIARTLHYSIERKRLENQLHQANAALEQRVAERTSELQTAIDAVRESEARYRALTALSSDWYWERDAQLRFTLMSKPDTGLSEIELNTFLGHTCRDAPGVVWDEPELTQLEAITAARQPFRDFEIGRIYRDGPKHYVRMSGEPVFDAAGAFKGYRGVGSDVTARRRAQEALRLSETRYRSVADSAMDAFVTADAAGCIVGWNPAAERIFGYTVAEVLGQPLTLLMPQRFRDQHLEGMKRAQTGGGQRMIGKSAELVGRRKDATEFPLELSLSHWTVDEGRFFTGIIRDITERRLAEAKVHRLTQLYAALSQSNEAIVRCAGADELFQRICRVAVELGGMKMAWIGITDPETRRIGIAASFGDGADEYLQGIEISANGDSPFGKGPIGRAVSTNQPVWCQDFLHEPITAPWQKRRAASGFGASASLPLHRNGVAVGALTLYAGEVGAFDEAARVLLCEMAADISFALDNFAREEARAHAENHLITAEQQFRGLVEQSLTGIYISRDGVYQYANPRLEQMLGYGPGELVGVRANDIVLAEDLPIMQAERDKLRAGASTSAYEVRVRRKDGSVIQLGVQGRIFASRGEPSTVGMAQDITEKKRSEDEIKRYIAQIETAFMSTVEMATTMSEMRDPYTAGHERRVGEIAVAIGAELGFDARRQEGLRVAGFLHDIGKITIPAEILSKPGKLSKIEFAMIKGHAEASYEILKKVEFPWPVAEVALQHHERTDGSGYPRGLKGAAILLEARILAVADVMEAMSAHRPYREGLGLEAALAEIERGRGTAYDPDAADACLRLFRNKGYALPA